MFSACWEGSKRGLEGGFADQANAGFTSSAQLSDESGLRRRSSLVGIAKFEDELKALSKVNHENVSCVGVKTHPFIGCQRNVFI